MSLSERGTVSEAGGAAAGGGAAAAGGGAPAPVQPATASIRTDPMIDPNSAPRLVMGSPRSIGDHGSSPTSSGQPAATRPKGGHPARMRVRTPITCAPDRLRGPRGAAPSPGGG